MTDRNLAPEKPREDVLEYLPHAKIVEYRKGQVIYSEGQRSTTIHLVTSGVVKVLRLADDGRGVVVDLYLPGEVFGESALLNLARRPEEAIALENATLMAWTTSEIEGIVMKQPRLGVALLRILVRRTIDYTIRIQSFSADSTGRRLARSLLRFSERLGEAEPDGSVTLGPLTHHLLSQYVGTAREIVTIYMNQFREQGCLQYSRKGIILHCDLLREWLRQNV